MSPARVLFVAISSATGACFVMLAWMGIHAAVAPVHRFHPFSVVIAAVAVCLGYLAFRAAIIAKIEDETLVRSLLRGMVGAFLAIMAMIASLAMFNSGTQAVLAHALGRYASSFTNFRLLAASVLLGFGTGFVARSA